MFINKLEEAPMQMLELGDMVVKRGEDGAFLVIRHDHHGCFSLLNLKNNMYFGKYESLKELTENAYDSDDIIYKQGEYELTLTRKN